MPEAVARILLRVPRRLHDAVKRQMLDHDDLAHEMPPAVPVPVPYAGAVPGMSPPPTRTADRRIDSAEPSVRLDEHGYGGHP
ncbi:hypothetical protein Plo01_17400 [Planobispora longispora]|uniref:Uncharacterized protein n=1 Tax=Planobispora longispora TaxID=28887 RepID=A0A8J3RFJ4_9ACTN|nr:hypothetical protein Plo01_17400 [Planobispora longispora]